MAKIIFLILESLYASVAIFVYSHLGIPTWRGICVFKKFLKYGQVFLIIALARFKDSEDIWFASLLQTFTNWVKNTCFCFAHVRLHRQNIWNALLHRLHRQNDEMYWHETRHDGYYCSVDMKKPVKSRAMQNKLFSFRLLMTRWKRKIYKNNAKPFSRLYDMHKINRRIFNSYFSLYGYICHVF